MLCKELEHLRVSGIKQPGAHRLRQCVRWQRGRTIERGTDLGVLIDSAALSVKARAGARARSETARKDGIRLGKKGRYRGHRERRSLG